MAEGLDDLLDGLLGAHDGHQVVPVDPVLVARARDRPGLAPAQAGELQLAGDALGDVADHGGVLALDPDRAVDERGGRVLVRAAVAQGHEAEEQHPGDAVEVGHRVADGGDGGPLLVAGQHRRVAGGGQRRRVRGGPREGPRDEGRVHSQGAAHAHARPGRREEDQEHEGQGPAGGADDVEEIGAGLDSDGEGEDGQSEGAQGHGHIDGHALRGPPRGERDPGEEYGGGAQAHPLDLDVAHAHAQSDEEEQDENGVLGEMVQESGDHGGAPAFPSLLRCAQRRLCRGNWGGLCHLPAGRCRTSGRAAPRNGPPRGPAGPAMTRGGAVVRVRDSMM